jgi:hypothetical protein
LDIILRICLILSGIVCRASELRGTFIHECAWRVQDKGLHIPRRTQASFGSVRLTFGMSGSKRTGLHRQIASTSGQFRCRRRFRGSRTSSHIRQSGKSILKGICESLYQAHALGGPDNIQSMIEFSRWSDNGENSPSFLRHSTRNPSNISGEATPVVEQYERLIA